MCHIRVHVKEFNIKLLFSKFVHSINFSKVKILYFLNEKNSILNFLTCALKIR
jgi:hypothetical protein